MGRTLDMTSGNIRKQLVTLAVPLIIGSILQQLYNTADALVIGRYVGQEAFAAVGVAGNVMNLFIFVLGGCCTGISILLAQFFGNGDFASFRREHFLATAFGCLFTVIVSLMGIALLDPILKLIQTPAEIIPDCKAYLVIIFAGLLATYLYNLCAATLRSVGNTKLALIVLAVAIVCNLILDVLFVAGFSMGIAGAAAATVVSQLFSFIVCKIYMKRKLPELEFGRDDMKYDAAMMNRTVNFAAVSALQQSSLYIGKLLVQGAVNSMGTNMIAAFTATTRIEGFVNSFADCGGTAVSMFVAQNVGAGNKKRARQGFGTALTIMLPLGLFLAAVMALTARDITLPFMLKDASKATIAGGVGYLHTVSCFYALCFLGCAYVGFYRGIGKVGIPVIGTVSHITLRVILSYILADALGLAAVGLATGLGWIVVVSIHTAIYFSYRKKDLVLEKAKENS